MLSQGAALWVNFIVPFAGDFQLRYYSPLASQKGVNNQRNSTLLRK
jgi:hypothetical protein